MFRSSTPPSAHSPAYRFSSKNYTPQPHDRHGLPCHLRRDHDPPNVKVDPASLSKLDRRSNMLLQAARQQTELVDEKHIAADDDPGMDTLRGSFGAIGSIIRARSARQLSQSSGPDSLRVRTARPFDPESVEGLPPSKTPESGQSYGGLRRHQLYDVRMPGSRSALVPAQFPGDRSDAPQADDHV
jgi:magnesium transporter